MIRLLGTFLFVTVFFIASDCNAQRTRGLFRRSAAVQQHGRQTQTPNLQQQLDRQKSSQSSRVPALSRYLNQQSWDPGSGNQRYIGGFHYTHFQNIGIPSGDIGLRGNAYHWRPW